MNFRPLLIATFVVATFCRPEWAIPSALALDAREPLARLQPSPQPGPGLGPSKADPTGVPIRLALPPGYGLVRIHGGTPEFDFEAFMRSPGGGAVFSEPANGIDGFDVTLVLSVDPVAYRGVVSNRSSCTGPDTWSGWILWSENDEAQNLWVPGFTCQTAEGVTPILEFPPPSPEALRQGPVTVSMSLGGFCVNLDRHVPDTEHAFRIGVITNDAGLSQILDAIAGKNLREGSSVIQDVVWDYTDFDGFTPRNRTRLAALP